MTFWGWNTFPRLPFLFHFFFVFFVAVIITESQISCNALWCYCCVIRRTYNSCHRWISWLSVAIDFSIVWHATQMGRHFLQSSGWITLIRIITEWKMECETERTVSFLIHATRETFARCFVVVVVAVVVVMYLRIVNHILTQSYYKTFS